MPMPEKKHNKVSFTEEDAATLTQRYDPTTVLTLLQEVAHYPHSKIDWNELVKKTSTGISNARQYQMLWRHLAYREALPENLEGGAEPLDDDSDLECELEALPPVSADSASEAAACVKVMIASRSLSESTPSSSTIEAPLTINVPVCHSSRTPNESSRPSNLMQGTSIIFPVTVQRQTLPTVSSTDGIEAKGLVGGNMASKRKRKAWSEEEDMQLRAAVQRWGEGNWATMAKVDNFPIKRSPTQLAQRWSILRKKDGSTNCGTILTSPQYTTAEQLATRHSLSLALNMPFKKLTAPGMTDPARTSLNSSIKNQVQPCNTIETSTIHGSFVPPQHPSQRAEQIVKATTATAAAAQIVSSLNTVSQLKVAQARNAVDKPTGSSLIKSSIPASLPSNPKGDSNVPYVCPGSSAAPVSSHSAIAVTSPASCSTTVKTASPTVEDSPAGLSILSEQDKHVTSVVNEVPLKQEVNPTEEFRVSDPNPAPKEKGQEDETLKRKDQGKSMNLPFNKEVETLVMKNTKSGEILEDKTGEDQGTFNMETNHQIAADSNLDKGSQDLNQDKSTNLINESSEDQNMNEKKANLPSVVQDECS